MQTKSEMISRIAELAKENAELQQEVKQWKHEYEMLDACIELEQGKITELQAYKDVNEDFKKAWEELKAENERLKDEVETRDNLVEHFRKEAINWAKISNDCIKDIENYKQTLQEIKTIAEENKDTVQYGGICKSILMVITKAEEE